MKKFTKKILLIPTYFVSIAAIALVIYLKYFADFPIEKKRLFRILKSTPRGYIDNYGQDVSFFSDGLKLKGTLYGDETGGKKPGIVLLHGATSYGRKLALYRFLGRRFSERGYLALSVDFRGYNESEDPRVGDPDMFAFLHDAKAALSFLLSRPDVDSSRIYFVGHSLGGSVAFVLGSLDDKIKKVVSIGPSRRVTEVFLAELNQKIDNGMDFIPAHEFRLAREMNLVGYLPLSLVKESVSKILIDEYVHYYAQDNHKPLLLVDGQLEDEFDKVFLNDLYKKLTSPSDYRTFQNVAHYHNTINWDGGSILLFDRHAVDELVDYIDSWLRTSY